MLTATAVAKLKASDKRREIPDAGAPGLRLVIHPTGAKVWITRFRRPNGKQGNLTLGYRSGREDHQPTLGHPLTLTAARILANDLGRQRSREVDVISLRNAEKHRKRVTLQESTANTFAIGARDFIDEHTVRKTGKKPRLAGGRTRGCWAGLLRRRTRRHQGLNRGSLARQAGA